MTMDDIQITVGSHNTFLKEVASNRNPSPPLRTEIRMRDEILRLREEERICLDFYRSAAASHKARLKKLDEATIMFMEDLLAFNKQVHESNLKSELAQASYDENFRINWRHSQRIEIVRSLCFKLRLYGIVMKTNLSLHEEAILNFLKDVAEEMRLDNASMVVDRHTTLRFMYEELYQDYHKKATELKELKEKHVAYISHMDHEIMIHLNQMMSLQDRLKHIKNEVIHREAEITHLMSESSITALGIYHLKTAIHSLVTNLQACRGDDVEPMEAIEALKFIEYHFHNLNYAVAKVRSMSETTPKTKSMSRRTRRRSKSPKTQSKRSSSRKSRRIFGSDTSDFSKKLQKNLSSPMPKIHDNTTSNAAAEGLRGGSRISLPRFLEQRAGTKCCKLPKLSMNSTLTL